MVEVQSRSRTIDCLVCSFNFLVTTAFKVLFMDYLLSLSPEVKNCWFDLMNIKASQVQYWKHIAIRSPAVEKNRANLFDCQCTTNKPLKIILLRLLWLFPWTQLSKLKSFSPFFRELFLQINLNVLTNMASIANSNFLTIWGIPHCANPSISGCLSFIGTSNTTKSDSPTSRTSGHPWRRVYSNGKMSPDAH